MFRIISLMVGYIFGNFLTADVLTWRLFHMKADDIGSGNPGMANITSQLGLGYGLLVLAGDVTKTIAACLICRYLLYPDMGEAAALYGGFGVCLGHDFPVWNRFKGGKGVAVTCTFIVLVLPVWGLISDMAGLAAVFLTGSLAVGAVVIPCVFTLAAFIKLGVEAGLVMLAASIMMVSRHFEGLKEMKSGEGKRVHWSRKRPEEH